MHARLSSRLILGFILICRLNFGSNNGNRTWLYLSIICFRFFFSNRTERKNIHEWVLGHVSTEKTRKTLFLCRLESGTARQLNTESHFFFPFQIIVNWLLIGLTKSRNNSRSLLVSSNTSFLRSSERGDNRRKKSFLSRGYNWT